MSTSEASSSTNDSSSPSVKRPRTEAQIRATEKMKQKRKELLEFGDDDALGAAEEIYLEKKNRREQKKLAMQSIVEEKLEEKLQKYHSKLMDEINRPLTGYWSKIFEEEVEPPKIIAAVPEKKHQPSRNQQWEEERLRSTKLATEQRAGRRNPFVQNLREVHDFSRWIRPILEKS